MLTDVNKFWPTIRNASICIKPNVNKFQLMLTNAKKY